MSIFKDKSNIQIQNTDKDKGKDKDNKLVNGK